MLPLAQGSQIRLQSMVTRKYLQIRTDLSIDAQGSGASSVFIVYRLNSTHIRLRSAEYPNRWLQMAPNGRLDGHGRGGSESTFYVSMTGPNIIMLSSASNHDLLMTTGTIGDMMTQEACSSGQSLLRQKWKVLRVE
eukprot:gnl/Dysnectes_brevis/2522_a3027_1631.p1 GENE.gnl/Dysnectes_brevis/2522_a3027_1631~~gnl/Dysnectes_brevis/2522_a3027_1631.p1  ORF type:complete len:136 (+),score=1.60 gnl/Dysnectes_brevis/2522_a3027_1631:30-437(+)